MLTLIYLNMKNTQSKRILQNDRSERFVYKTSITSITSITSSMLMMFIIFTKKA